MATDFWSSTHYKRWLVDHETLRLARAEDEKHVSDSDCILLINIMFANVLTHLGTRLNLRQRAIATATVFFRRFYIKNSYCDTDPFVVLGACCYVAAKAEECPVHVKTIISELRSVLEGQPFHFSGWTSDNYKIAEMEFYLVDDLECDLVIFHPYRTLFSLVRDANKPSNSASEMEAGESGVGVSDDMVQWGSGDGRLLMAEAGIQMAWFLINDTYRSDICLLYPPHLIATAALYLTCILQPQTRRAHVEWMDLKQAALAAHAQQSGTSTRRSLRHATSNSSLATSASKHHKQSESDEQHQQRKANVGPVQDFVGFFAQLNVNMPLIATIAQEMIAFYALCDRYKEDFNPSFTSKASSSGSNAARGYNRQSLGSIAVGQTGGVAPGATHSSGSHSGSRNSSLTPGGSTVIDDGAAGQSRVQILRSMGTSSFEVNSPTLLRILARMQALKEAEMGHVASGVGPANKVLERAQAAG